MRDRVLARVHRGRRDGGVGHVGRASASRGGQHELRLVLTRGNRHVGGGDSGHALRHLELEFDLARVVVLPLDFHNQARPACRS